MSKKIKDAEDRLKKAEEGLARAQEEARIAKLEALSREVEAKFRELGRAYYDLNYAAEFDPELKAVAELIEHAQDEFCAQAFGARRRLELLHALDPDRWALEGDYVRSLSGLTTDEDVAHEIATWIFDQGFGRGSLETIREMDVDQRARFEVEQKRAIKILGDIGVLGFQLWQDGRHDT